MFILKDLLEPLQENFSQTRQGQKRKYWFVYTFLAVADSWFGNDGLWSQLERGGKRKFNLLCRMRSNITLFDFLPTPAKDEPRKAGRPRKYGDRLGSVDECALRYKEKACSYKVFLYGKEREVLAYTQDVILKTMKCAVRIVWVYRKTRYVAIMTTDLNLGVKEIIEYYGARWKIEAGFKEIKQEIGSAKSQTRNAEAALAPHFQSICPVPTQRPQNSFVRMLLRMVA